MQAIPQKWHKIYNDDKEKRFFVGKDGNSGLIRGKDKKTGKAFTWRSAKAIADEADLTEKEVIDIANKFVKMNVVQLHPNGDKYGYWETVAPELANPVKSAVAEDQDKRIKDASKI